MSRRKSILWAVSIAFLLFLAFPEISTSIREGISRAIEHLREDPCPRRVLLRSISGLADS